MPESSETMREIPEIFIDQVKEALENLYNFSALQRSRLVQTFDSPGGEGDVTGARWLRSKLFEAIETLNPKQDAALASGAARIYNLVYLHYVGGMTLQEAAQEVGISRRQAHRDLRRGQESVSAILWGSQERKEIAEAKAEPAQLSSIETELTRLEGPVTAISLQKLLENALRVVQNLSMKRNIRLEAHLPEDEILMTTNPAIAQQVITHILSQVIQHAALSHLAIDIKEECDSLHIIMSYSPATETPAKPSLLPTIEQLTSQLGWALQYADSELRLVIRSAKKGSLVLIVDDNQGLVNLLEQYLTGHSYRVVSVHNGEDALQAVQQRVPDAIILDLMMPGMDGWELLQHLRTNSETQTVPVIICSVINDPELAYSLGASRFVAKPVTEKALLDALEELHI